MANKVGSFNIRNIDTTEIGDRVVNQLHLHFPVSDLTCTVCKKRPLASLDSVYAISESHFVYVDNFYYFLPSWHPNCRELFLLNPIAYE